MVDFGKNTGKRDICYNVQFDARRVPISTWVRETKPIIEKLSSWESEGKLRYTAFGATALGAHGYSRPTKDVDIVVTAGQWSFEEIATAISKELGLTKCPRGENRLQMLVKETDDYHYVLELWDNYIYVMDCDEQMWKRTVLGQSLGFPVKTLCVEDMVSSKLGRFFTERREEDISDIAYLLREMGLKDYDYFVQRIQKIRRNGKTIDDFLFEEITALSERLGKEATTKLHSEITNRKLYGQLLKRIMFQFAKRLTSVDEMANACLLYKKETESILKKLEITLENERFVIPKKPSAVIGNLVQND